MGVEVQIWADDCRSDFPDELPPQVSVKPIRSTHSVTGVFFLYMLIREYSPDVILTPSERQTRVTNKARAMFRNKPLLIACVHNLYSKQYQSLPDDKIRRRKKNLSTVYPKIDGVICVSHSVAADFGHYIEKCLDNLSVIYNPVIDTDPLHTEGRYCPVLPDCYGKVPVIVTVGNVVPQKNHVFLIQCFNRLREMRECSLVIVGTGSDFPGIQAQVARSRYCSDIYLVGHQSNPYPYIAKADVFAFTSDYEGFGNVVVESLACGIPVVSTDSGGPAEILTDPDCGEIVGLGDAEAFVSAMNRWLDKKIDKKKLIQYAVDNFSTDSIADQYLTLCNSLIQDRE